MPIILPAPQTETKHMTDDQFEKMMDMMNKLQTNVTSLRTDVEKLRTQMADKVQKAVLSEIESKITHHSKSIDATSKKLFDLQNNLSSFIQQPISHSLIDTLRTQIAQEITESIKKVVATDISELKTVVEEKITETKNMIQNAKRAMFAR